MLTDREILDAIPTNQFDEQTKMLWFGRFIERMVLDKLGKQDPYAWDSAGDLIYHKGLLLDDPTPVPLYARPVPAQPAVDLNTNDRGEPDAIYLQLHDPDDIDVTQAADYRCDGVTWCWERIHANDVRYVREDLD